MTRENYYHWGIANREPQPVKAMRCDPRLLKQLGVRREVCEAIELRPEERVACDETNEARAWVDEQGVGE